MIFLFAPAVNATTVDGVRTAEIQNEQRGAAVDFIDESLENLEISTLGIITEKYNHSTYVYQYSNRTQSYVGPREKDKFLLSVATGATKTLTSSTTLSANISFSATLDSPLKAVIFKGFCATISGSLSHTWAVGSSYAGPSDGSGYNTRSIYAAMDYDLYSTYVTEYQVFDVYNGSMLIDTVTYNVGTKIINSVKVPRDAEYSVDENI